MSKQLCFIIENNELYLDKVLVSFNRTPIFLTCCDNYNNYYLVLCSDIENLEYIVEKQSLKTLWQMLTQRISMRSALLDCDCFWLIKSGESISEDIVEKDIISKIDHGVLPEENALYEQINKEDAQYVEQITSAYLSETTFGANQEIDDFVDFPVDIVSLSLDALTNVVQCYQDFGPSIKAIGNCLKTIFSDKDFKDNVKKSLSYKELCEQKEIELFELDLFDDNYNKTDTKFIIAA